MKLKALLLALAAAATALSWSPVCAHEICIGGDAPRVFSGRRFRTCKSYRGLPTCVSPQQEQAQVVRTVWRYGAGRNTRAKRACRDVLFQMQCAQADAWAGHLFDDEAGALRETPFLCEDFAQTVYGLCKDIVMNKNPFLPAAARGTLSSRFPNNATAFAAAQGAFSDSYCYSGTPYAPSPPAPFEGGDTVCFEKLLPFSFPDAVHVIIEPVPGHPSLLALGSQNGLVNLWRMRGNGLAPELVGTLLDWSSRVVFSGERGLLGLAFHKDFSANGRLFISFSCAPGSLCARRGNTVVEELRVQDASTEVGLRVDTARARNVVFTLQQPFANHNGGQILFSPAADQPHLFVMLGDGGSGGDPGNRAQNGRELLGKILRLDVDSPPARGLGYAIPADNPFNGRQDVRSEIWALGLRNPWRCSFDAGNPAYFFCGDVGQNSVEEVDLIVKGGNYGWKRFEGDRDFNTNVRPLRDTAVVKPIMTYTHSENDANGRASITGGFVYRGSSDPTLVGLYVFADYYDRLYVAQESPAGSAQFAFRRFGVACSRDSPLPCSTSQNGIFTFGQDSARDLYFASREGLHRVVSSDSCGS